MVRPGYLKQSLGSRAFDIGNALFLLLVFFVTLYPFWYVLIASVSDALLVAKNKVDFWPRGLNLKAYVKAVKEPEILRAYLNTVKYTVVGTAVNIAVTILTAYPLSKKRFRGRTLFLFLIAITMFFGGGLIPFFMVVRNLGLINRMWALILPSAVSTWLMLITKTYLLTVPESLEESAQLDGANDVRILLSIVVPLIKPIIATLTIFYAVGHWNSFFSALIFLNDNKKYPLQIVLRRLIIEGEVTRQSEILFRSALPPLQMKYATIILTMLPIITIYPFLQRHFIKGVMIGSIKG